MSAVKIMRNHLWAFPALALVALVVGQICAEQCEYIQGDILGVDLNVLGLGFYFLLLVAILLQKKFYPRDWLTKAITASVSLGVGAELVFLKFQVENSTYCPKCLVSGFFFLAMFLLMAGNIKKWVAAVLIALGVLFTSLTFNGSVVPSYAQETGYPGFGKARAETELIVYSDYFCPACRHVDRELAEALMKLRDRVRIILVDVPLHKGSVPYAEVFLYAWFEEGNDLEKALRVRETLFEAAEKKTDQAGVLEMLRSMGIPFREDRKAARKIFKDFYSPLLKKDNVRATPTLVVVRGGSRTAHKGRKEILKALEEISKP
jgi:protein-disulfide isomerase